MSGILDRLPGVHHEQPLLGIHVLRLAGRDAEEQGIELLDPLDESAPLDVGPVVFGLRVTVKRPPVPAARRNLTDTVPRLEEILPEALHGRRLRKGPAYTHDSNEIAAFRGARAYGGGGNRLGPSIFPRRIGRCPGVTLDRVR